MKKNNMSWIICIVFFVLFLILSFFVIRNDILVIDNYGYNIIHNYLFSNKMTFFIKVITNFGGSICLCTLAILSVIVIKNKNIGFSLCLNLLCIFLCNFILKHVFCRTRPYDKMIISESGYSFPSGHAMISMAFYGYLIYLIYKNINNKYIKWGSIIFFSLIIFVIGISRIYLGVHYTSDILGGYLIGISYLVLYINIINKNIDILK